MSFINRKNIRLKAYDYSQTGSYFVTVCMNERRCLLGEINDNQMVLNDAGLMVWNYYQDLENKFPNVKCGEYVVMPNHFHCIIHIKNRADIESAPTVDNHYVEAIPCGCPNNKRSAQSGDNISVGVNLCVDPKLEKGEHAGTPLHKIIQWFKTMTTNAYINGVKTKNWQSFNKRLWQRNYYEHIIRNEEVYLKICQYIRNNPLKWDLDKLNPQNYIIDKKQE
ncbi:REP element-mobilizing transposase RayT [Allofrancisella inopinata]|uniref:Transposase IS200-like domain-containing protein n=1 Tax=Allofrancisella inopinata TaxID=1085647 RepID=A0AAE7CQD4_9GAMM|nr:transposase [Allofrancisella inopinata]QIV95760.1 hypothetical protein E4K63_02495 [Allofrancisella inopinata]TDT72848.1 REP element-mobilizing transposase RayT [Allofrancisella inopinata]